MSAKLHAIIGVAIVAFASGGALLLFFWVPYWAQSPSPTIDTQATEPSTYLCGAFYGNFQSSHMYEVCLTNILFVYTESHAGVQRMMTMTQVLDPETHYPIPCKCRDNKIVNFWDYSEGK